MEKWKAAIIAGNKAYNSCDYLVAERNYVIACERAKTLFGLTLDFEKRLAALIVSHQNLSDLYLKESNHNKALKTLHNMVDFIRISRIDYEADNCKCACLMRACRRLSTETLQALKKNNVDCIKSRILIRDINQVGHSLVLH